MEKDKRGYGERRKKKEFEGGVEGEERIDGRKKRGRAQTWILLCMPKNVIQIGPKIWEELGNRQAHRNT